MPILRVSLQAVEPPATTDDIQGIAGPLDDSIVTAIQMIGATGSEILQASEWLMETYYTGSILSRPMDDRIRRVYDILDYARNGFNGNSRTH